jgi:hypothetical protein
VVGWTAGVEPPEPAVFAVDDGAAASSSLEEQATRKRNSAAHSAVRRGCFAGMRTSVLRVRKRPRRVAGLNLL